MYNDKKAAPVKKLILVASPPASGKTYVARQLAKTLKHVVYLDKDTLISLSRQIFKAAGQPYDRSSEFFQKNVRDYEYETILNLATEALRYEDTVIVNAPFTKEVRNPHYIRSLRKNLGRKNIRLCVVWVVTDPEVCHQRMLHRNSSRDTWKLDHWEEYMASCDFSVPEGIGDPKEKKELIVFRNSNPKEFRISLRDTVAAIKRI